MRRAVSLSVLGLLVLLALTRYPVPIYRDHTFLHFPVWEWRHSRRGSSSPIQPLPQPRRADGLRPQPPSAVPHAWLLKFFTAQQAYSIHFFGHALLSFWLMAFLLMGRLDRTKALILAAFWVSRGRSFPPRRRSTFSPPSAGSPASCSRRKRPPSPARCSPSR